MRNVLAALAAIAVVALIAWAGTTHFDSDLEAPTITATTGFVGAVTGAVTGNLTGNVTGNVTGSATKIVRCGAVPDTATATASGDAHILISSAGGTLFVWNATTTTHNAVAVALTQDAN